MAQTTTYVTNAAIGIITFHQHDLDGFEFTYEDWVNLAISMFDDLVPEGVVWLPHQSEIIGPVVAYNADEEDQEDAFLTVARTCMTEAFEQLATQ